MSLEQTPLGKKGSLKQCELPKMKATVMAFRNTEFVDLLHTKSKKKKKI